MPRWEPDARGRMMRAALELFARRGYEQTTVADIAAHVGLTERTYFRHFADKREVLFEGAAELETLVRSTVEAAPPSVSPLRAIVDGLSVCGPLFVDRELAGARQRVIDSSVELQERELVKLAQLSEVCAQALRGRGLDAYEASVAAETGMAIFRLAFARWLSGEVDRGFATCVLDVLGVVAAQSARAAGIGVAETTA